MTRLTYHFGHLLASHNAVRHALAIELDKMATDKKPIKGILKSSTSFDKGGENVEYVFNLLIDHGSNLAFSSLPKRVAHKVMSWECEAVCMVRGEESLPGRT